MTATTTKQSPFALLQGENYMSLTTYRKNGTPVATPVWFVEHDGKLYMFTQADSWKAKRIQRNNQVEVAPCNVRGELKSDEKVTAYARILPPEEFDQAYKLLLKKYGLQLRFFRVLYFLRRTPAACIEISPEPFE